MCSVLSFYRSDGESPGEMSSEPLFSVNNGGSGRPRSADRPGYVSLSLGGVLWVVVVVVVCSGWCPAPD